MLASPALGLFEMRERAATMGGTYTIESHPGAGTRVVAVIPSHETGVG